MEKTENQLQNAACEQITTSEKARIFVQTPFSHSTLKLEQISHRKTTRFFPPLPVSA